MTTQAMLYGVEWEQIREGEWRGTNRHGDQILFSAKDFTTLVEAHEQQILNWMCSTERLIGSTVLPVPKPDDEPGCDCLCHDAEDW